jgi:hypothetical protein
VVLHVVWLKDTPATFPLTTIDMLPVAVLLALELTLEVE